jgi:hypothetical protein
VELVGRRGTSAHGDVALSPMIALGHQPTLSAVEPRSAVPLDIAEVAAHVGLGPILLKKSAVALGEIR